MHLKGTGFEVVGLIQLAQDRVNSVAVVCEQQND
jgi:hypothetical protein